MLNFVNDASAIFNELYSSKHETVNEHDVEIMDITAPTSVHPPEGSITTTETEFEAITKPEEAGGQ